MGVMFRSVVFLVTTLSLVQNVVPDAIQDTECDGVSEASWSMNLSVQSRREESGEWITSFSACKDYKNSSKSVRLDVKQKVIEIGGKLRVHITGVLRDAPAEEDIQRLKFFPKGGTYAVITNDGMTTFRESAEKQKDFACVFTSRPLKNNELFEVKVDKKIDKFPGFPMGIGVTTHSPVGMEFPGWMGQLKSGTWVLYDTTLIHNGNTLNDAYGEGYQKLQPGDRVGVMRTESGTLHFFLNGVDQGLAATNIPYPIYGTVDLVRNIAQVTIVDKSSHCPK